MNNADLLVREIGIRFPAMRRVMRRRIALHYINNPRPNMNAQHTDGRIFCMVAAFVRHNFTEYEHLYKIGFNKPEARQFVQPSVDIYLRAWKGVANA